LTITAIDAVDELWRSTQMNREIQNGVMYWEKGKMRIWSKPHSQSTKSSLARPNFRQVSWLKPLRRKHPTCLFLVSLPALPRSGKRLDKEKNQKAFTVAGPCGSFTRFPILLLLGMSNRHLKPKLFY